MNNNIITYYFSKRVLLAPLFLFGTPLLFISFVWLIEPDIITYSILILLCVLLFVMLLPDNLTPTYYYFCKKPALVISKECITDNINKQVYNWPDIFEIFYHEKSKMIWINIGDGFKDNYLKNKSGLKRILLKMHLDMTHGAFWLNPKTIDCNETELLTNLIKFHKSFSGKS